LTTSLRTVARPIRRAATEVRPILAPRHVAVCTAAYLRDRRGRRAYRILTTAELLATRRTDTAFVFGSGRSLLDITDREWERIAENDTISLREFPRQSWIRADYHVTGEVDFLDDYAHRLRENPLYADTVFVVQGGWRGHMGNDLIGWRLLPAEAPVFRFRRTSRGRYAPPSRDPSVLVHGFNSIVDATNLAVALRFRRIVLAGVDLYDKQYFWLGPGETRRYEKPGVEASSLFTGHDAIVSMLGDWHDLLAREGTELAVYNPRSLLAERLPVFSW
jgi:hypothetical protein